MRKEYINKILIVIFIFSSFLSLHIMLKKIPIKEDRYTINREGMNNPHKPIPPLFHLNEEGKYFIHPATKADAKATFTFNKNGKLLWHFTIQDGSKVGKIKFIVKKNEQELKSFIVDTKHDYKLDIKIRKDDKITIIANPYGSTAGDWGNLEIFRYEPNYLLKLILIPTIWVIFFIYLMNKGYTYIAFNSYFGFILTLLAEKVTSGALLFADIGIYTTFFFLFAFIFVLIYQELQKYKKYKIATLLKLITTVIIYMIPTSFIIFYLVFNKPIDWNILFAIYQTNFNEAIEFIQSFIPTYYLFIIAIFISLMAYIFWYQEKKEKELIERTLLIFIIILLAGFTSESFLKTRLANFIYSTFLEYNNQIERLKEFHEHSKSSKIKFSASKKEKAEVYVVVIGESLTRFNMSLYGHFRDTTPRQLKQAKEDNLIVFTNAYSNAGNTMMSLSLALTEANQYNGKKQLESLSFIDIFNKAGFNTYWLSTQDILGKSNTITSVIAQTAQRAIDLTSKIDPKTGDTTYFDENAIDELKKRASTNKNTLIIIHLYGNHFHYQDRYPKSYEKFKTTKPFMIGTNKDYILEDYTGYDNSVYYNDYVVSSLLEVLKKRKGVSAFIYFSDHGEDIARHRGHTSRLDGFTFGMVHIPMTAWLSPEYIKRYPNSYKNFISNKDKLFSNDLIYETIIGLAHINTKHYNPNFDISSSKYNLNPKIATTLHGKLHYTDSKNYYYWRKYNTKILRDNNFTDKIVISSADSLGKFNEAWNLGYRSFELNLKFIEDKKHFQTGLKNYDTKGNLVDLLSYFNIKEIKGLFLNLANLNSINIDSIENRLNIIDSKLNIKQISTLIVKDKNLAKRLKQSGWKIALNKNIDNTNIDFTIIDAKDYIKSNNNSKFVVKNAFDIADIKLESKINNLKYLNDKDVAFVFANFKSVFDN